MQYTCQNTGMLYKSKKNTTRSTNWENRPHKPQPNNSTIKPPPNCFLVKLRLPRIISPTPLYDRRLRIGDARLPEQSPTDYQATLLWYWHWRLLSQPDAL